LKNFNNNKLEYEEKYNKLKIDYDKDIICLLTENMLNKISLDLHDLKNNDETLNVRKSKLNKSIIFISHLF